MLSLSNHQQNTQTMRLKILVAANSNKMLKAHNEKTHNLSNASFASDLKRVSVQQISYCKRIRLHKQIKKTHIPIKISLLGCQEY